MMQKMYCQNIWSSQGTDLVCLMYLWGQSFGTKGAIVDTVKTDAKKKSISKMLKRKRSKWLLEQLIMIIRDTWEWKPWATRKTYNKSVQTFHIKQEKKKDNTIKNVNKQSNLTKKKIHD